MKDVDFDAWCNELLNEINEAFPIDAIRSDANNHLRSEAFHKVALYFGNRVSVTDKVETDADKTHSSRVISSVHEAIVTSIYNAN